MKKLESSLTNMVLVLVLVAVITGVLLAWVNSVTADPIAEQKKITLANGIKSVMCSDNLTVVSTDTVPMIVSNKELKFVVYNINDASGNSLGAAIESVWGGFSGDLKVLVGFNPEGKILGYQVLEHSETPGLGAKANDWFQTGAKGCIVGRQMNTGMGLAVKKDRGDVEAITASTITSRAFLNAVNNAYAVFAKQCVGDTAGDTTQVTAESAVGEKSEIVSNESQKN